MVWESTEGFLDYSNISIVDSGQILPIYGHFLPLKFYKCGQNDFKLFEIMVPQRLQRIWKNFKNDWRSLGPVVLFQRAMLSTKLWKVLIFCKGWALLSLNFCKCQQTELKIFIKRFFTVSQSILKTHDNFINFRVMALLQRPSFLEILAILSQIYLLKMTSQQKSHAVSMKISYCHWCACWGCKC